jgi:hypothetical protein
MRCTRQSYKPHRPTRIDRWPLERVGSPQTRRACSREGFCSLVVRRRIGARDVSCATCRSSSADVVWGTDVDTALTGPADVCAVVSGRAKPALFSVLRPGRNRHLHPRRVRGIATCTRGASAGSRPAPAARHRDRHPHPRRVRRIATCARGASADSPPAPAVLSAPAAPPRAPRGSAGTRRGARARSPARRGRRTRSVPRGAGTGASGTCSRRPRSRGRPPAAPRG